MSGPMQWSRGGLVPVGSVVPSTEDDEPVGAYVPVMMMNTASVAAQPQAAPRETKKKPATPKDIVGLAKARLKEVKQELRRMKTLEKECGELERLIAAAEDTKPRAVVRELKRSAG